MSNENRFDEVHVIGAGGVGFYTAVALCREPRGAWIHVWDDDTFEGGQGAWRLPRVVDQGTLKVDFLRGHVRMVWGEEPPTIHQIRFTGTEAQDMSRWLVVDCTDSLMEARQAFWKEAKDRGAAMLRVSYDGNGIVVLSGGLPVWAPTGGYEMVPTLAQSFLAGGAAASAVHRLMEGKVVEDMEIRL